MNGPEIAEAIAEDMAKLEPATRRAVRPRLKNAGDAIASEAQRRASWSSRIPATIRTEVSYRQEREGVRVVAGGGSAPHARPYEGATGAGVFRHPVYADSAGLVRRRWTWVTEPTRPFLMPAAESKAAMATSEVQAALDDAARAIGFGGA